MKILVVDDDPSILGMLRMRLTGSGYEVETASDGESALVAVGESPPALVLLDVMMPGMTGWEVAKELRGAAATRSIKIVMLTAIGASVNEMTSPLYGVDAYLDKPFDFSELESTLAGLLTDG